jgi:hypothetical protein
VIRRRECKPLSKVSWNLKLSVSLEEGTERKATEPEGQRRKDGTWGYRNGSLEGDGERAAAASVPDPVAERRRNELRGYVAARP